MNDIDKAKKLVEKWSCVLNTPITHSLVLESRPTLIEDPVPHYVMLPAFVTEGAEQLRKELEKK